jgi:hypothetical protein
MYIILYCVAVILLYYIFNIIYIKYIVLYCIALYCIVLYCIIFHCIAS